MTIEDAMIVKSFRLQGTYRVVAALAAEYWPERNYCSGNQIEGRELCKEAAKVLNENPDAEPWN